MLIKAITFEMVESYTYWFLFMPALVTIITIPTAAAGSVLPIWSC